MPNSPTHPERRSRTPERRRVCDFCSEATALLFCRADAAKLCLACDREVHATAQLFVKHTRRLLCDACDSAPAVIVCSTHRFVLCQNCDFEIHNRGGALSAKGNGSSASASASASASSHDRRPLEGFSGQPSASEIASFVGLEGLDCSKSLGVEGQDFAEDEGETGILGELSDFWLWDAVSPQGVVSVADFIVASGETENHGFQAMVPLDTHPKDRNSTCGQHKQEMIRQLCELAKSETALHQEFEPDFGYQTPRYEHVIGVSDVYEGYQHGFIPVEVPGQEAIFTLQGSKDEEALNEAFLSDIFLGSNTEDVPLGSDRNSDPCNDAALAKNGSQETDRNVDDSVAILSKISTSEINTADRGSALSRYKEKKRSRRYEKHIRYESRKALAESRIRIRGRFAKVNQSNPQIQS